MRSHCNQPLLHRASIPLLTAPCFTLLIILFFLSPTVTLAKIKKSNQTTLDITPGTPEIRALDYTAECPCLFTGFAEVPANTSAPPTDVRISLYAMPDAKYREWINSTIKTNRPPLTSTSIALPNNTLTLLQPNSSTYTWSSGVHTIPTRGRFRVFSVFSAHSSASRITAGWTLDSKPETCPLRLSGPDAGRNGDVRHYVIGGTAVNRDEFAAYNVFLSAEGGTCTGSLIAPDWVLTAAHCEVEAGVAVRVGGTAAFVGKRRVVKRNVTHADYIEEETTELSHLSNDIALLQLDRPVHGVRLIALNSNPKGPTPGTIVRATGYGMRTAHIDSDDLRMIDNVVLSGTECRRRFSARDAESLARGIDDKIHVCTGRDAACERGGTFVGDSGGPVVARIPGGGLVQIGVTSYGVNEEEERHTVPDVAVRVSEFVPWVQEVTGGKATLVSWASVGNDAGGAVGDGGATRKVPIWVIVMSAALGAFLLIAGVLIAVAVVRRRSDDSIGA